MHYRALTLLVLGLLLSACNRASQSREAVQRSLMDHLRNNAGLDVSQLDVNISDVTFQGSEAHAKVDFKPKSSPDQGMTINYTLEKKGDKWVVKRRADSGHGSGTDAFGVGGGRGSQAGDPLPPGHPSLGGREGGQPNGPQNLPPGHPSVTDSGKPQK